MRNAIKTGWVGSSALGSVVGLVGLLGIGCSSEKTQQLDPQSFAMTSKTTPFYSDGELELFQTQLSVPLPVLRPSESQQQKLSTPIAPFDHTPWVTTDDVGIQVTWTLANLDEDAHSVKVMVDPWNEYGRYVPGFTQDGDEAIPNLSGIEDSYLVPGTKGGGSSRIRHTFTFADMDELATDFATVINIIQRPPPAAEAEEDDPRIGWVNHTFAIENRSGDDVYTDRFTPKVVPALVGFDIALRTTEAMNVALEFSIEIVDRDGERVREHDGDEPLLEAPETTYTIGD